MFDKIIENSSSFIKRKDLSNQFFLSPSLSLTFPVFAVSSLFFNEFIFLKPDNAERNWIIAGILAAAVSFISIKLKFLTYSGSLAAFILAIPIFGLGGVKWSAPVLTFFIISSILSKFRENRNPELKEFFAKQDRRDHLQVLANGGAAGLLIIINYLFIRSGSELMYAVFVSSLAAVCADTWGTETGTIFKKKTVSILSFKTVSPGSSGGISIPGTLGGFAGALLIAVSSLFWIRQNILSYVLLITAAGIFGSTVDSILGASVQRKNICTVCRKITERKDHCGKNAGYYSGFKWVSNDAVNFCCSVSGALFTLFIKLA